MGKLLSTTEVAARLGLSVPRIQTFIWEGRLPAMKVGRAYAIDEDDLKLVGNRKTGRPPEAKPATNKRTTWAANARNRGSTRENKGG